MSVRMCALLAATQLCAAMCPTADVHAVAWSTPTDEPSTDAAGQKVIGGAMPIGNGVTTAQVFPLTADTGAVGPPVVYLDAGVSFFVNMMSAVASDTALMKLGMVTVKTTPDLFANATAGSFCQSLDMRNASVTIATSLGSVTVRVDKLSDVIVADVAAAVPVQVDVVVQTLRPGVPFNYSGMFEELVASLAHSSSAPDVFLSDADAATLPAAAVGLSHRNLGTDAMQAFSYALKQQGFEHLIPTLRAEGLDKWSDRQFGMVAYGPGLARQNASHLASAQASTRFSVRVAAVANQTASSADWLAEVAALVGADLARDPAQQQAAHVAAWEQFWNRSYVHVLSGVGGAAPDLTTKYMSTRYLAAVQAGVPWMPVKFNGQTWRSVLPPVDIMKRQWGANVWWQNVRLPYQAMPAAGDYDTLANLFEFYLRTTAFTRRRSEEALNITGVFNVETMTHFGPYAPFDYAYPHPASSVRPDWLPSWMVQDPYLGTDLGGDSPDLELGMLILDHYMYTQDKAVLTRYLEWLRLVLSFFRAYYPVDAATGQREIFPAQGLETYWCTVTQWPPRRDQCVANDHPTIAGLTAVLRRALQLPRDVVTAQDVADWAAMQKALPPLPMTGEGADRIVLPFQGFNDSAPSPAHNYESPELYSVHPYRLLTTAGELVRGKAAVDVDPASRCLANSTRHTCALARSQNSGWPQGGMWAARLGLTDMAAAFLTKRAKFPAAKGYRFPGYAAETVGYLPGEAADVEEYSLMNMQLQAMLLQPADDDFTTGSFAVLPAWPCAWDVDFKLHAPLSTVVTGSVRNGTLVALHVDPPSRQSAMVVANCQAQ